MGKLACMYGVHTYFYVSMYTCRETGKKGERESSSDLDPPKKHMVLDIHTTRAHSIAHTVFLRNTCGPPDRACIRPSACVCILWGHTPFCACAQIVPTDRWKDGVAMTQQANKALLVAEEDRATERGVQLRSPSDDCKHSSECERTSEYGLQEYGVDTGGSDQYVLYIERLETLERVEEEDYIPKHVVSLAADMGGVDVPAAGFYMRSGRQYGPYGGPGGAEFNILQVTHAIFGSGSSGNNALTSIGVWTDAPNPPPAPPRSPTPPPPPPGPSTVTRPTRVALMTYLGDSFYDDGFSTGEEPFPF